VHSRKYCEQENVGSGIIVAYALSPFFRNILAFQIVEYIKGKLAPEKRSCTLNNALLLTNESTTSSWL